MMGNGKKLKKKKRIHQRKKERKVSSLSFSDADSFSSTSDSGKDTLSRRNHKNSPNLFETQLGESTMRFRQQFKDNQRALDNMSKALDNQNNEITQLEVTTQKTIENLVTKFFAEFQKEMDSYN